MFHNVRFVFGLLVCVICVLPVAAQEPPKKKKAKLANVEIRWVESKRIEGVTEDKGFQASCDPKEIMYLHKKPALVLTADNVVEAQLIRQEISVGGPSRTHWMGRFILTQKGREELSASFEGYETRLLTVVIDGKRTSLHCYEKDKNKLRSDECRAETFVPTVQWFPSKEVAERAIEAVVVR